MGTIKNGQIIFAELPQGKIFCYHGVYYMKTESVEVEDECSIVNCVQLNTGQLWEMSPSAHVEIIDIIKFR